MQVRIIVAAKGGFVLLRGGLPYFIKGADGTSYTNRLAQCERNYIRTWDAGNGDEVLTKAAKLNLTITMCLNVAHKRQGFNYDDVDLKTGGDVESRPQAMPFFITQKNLDAML
jgi:hypothetical protein